MVLSDEEQIMLYDVLLDNEYLDFIIETGSAIILDRMKQTKKGKLLIKSYSSDDEISKTR